MHAEVSYPFVTFSLTCTRTHAHAITHKHLPTHTCKTHPHTHTCIHKYMYMHVYTNIPPPPEHTFSWPAEIGGFLAGITALACTIYTQNGVIGEMERRNEKREKTN